MVDILSASFSIHSYESDAKMDAKISTLLGFFLEAAGFHATRLGVGHHQLMESINSFWALSKFNLRMETYPKWQDTITIETWPAGYNRLFAHRHFIIKNGSNQIIAQGTSDWVIMNAETRRMINPQEVIGHLPVENEGLDLDVRTTKIPLIGEETASMFSKKALFSDIDMNKHVNSIKYLDWSLDCINFDYLDHHKLAEVDINFQHEITFGKEVDLFFQTKTDGVFQFKGILKKENKHAFSVQLKFI
jgi:medium-chain acyl-[acyl-carrier-protein] hydrolase